MERIDRRNCIDVILNSGICSKALAIVVVIVDDGGDGDDDDDCVTDAIVG